MSLLSGSTQRRPMQRSHSPADQGSPTSSALITLLKVNTIPTEIWLSEATFDPPVNAKGIKNECGQTNS